MFEIGKKYRNLNENAGKVMERAFCPGSAVKRKYYVPKEITITACPGAFYRGVDDKGEVVIVDDDDTVFYEEVV